MTQVQMTPEEIIEYLNHSTVPTLLVEGKDDFKIYRWIEKKISDLELDVLPCGGRNSLLKVYEQRDRIKNKKVLFFADKDLWLFNEIPSEYKGIVFTEGYSIENDMYNAAKIKIESLIAEDKRTNFIKAVEAFCKWYSFEVSEYLNQRPYELDKSPKEILDNRTWELKSSFIQRRGYTEVNNFITTSILQEYSMKVRGKNLISLWEWFVEEKSLKGETIFEVTLIFLDDNSFVFQTINNIREGYSKLLVS